LGIITLGADVGIMLDNTSAPTPTVLDRLQQLW
jgi:hypothetical protein